MQAIPGKIKTQVILISNGMLDENTDENTIQADFSFKKLLFTKCKIIFPPLKLEANRRL